MGTIWLGKLMGLSGEVGEGVEGAAWAMIAMMMQAMNAVAMAKCGMDGPPMGLSRKPLSFLFKEDTGEPPVPHVLSTGGSPVPLEFVVSLFKSILASVEGLFP